MNYYQLKLYSLGGSWCQKLEMWRVPLFNPKSISLNPMSRTTKFQVILISGFHFIMLTWTHPHTYMTT